MMPSVFIRKLPAEAFETKPAFPYDEKVDRYLWCRNLGIYVPSDQATFVSWDISFHDTVSIYYIATVRYLIDGYTRRIVPQCHVDGMI